MRKVLIIRFKSMGDVVLTLPAVNLVRAEFPHSRIAFLTSKENVPILCGFAAVDEIIALDRVALRRLNPKAVFAGTIGLVWQLWRRRFDLAVDLQGYGEAALLTWLTGAPQRWGSVYRSGRRWAYTRRVNRDDRVHPADGYLSLLRQCGLNGTRSVHNQFRLPAGAAQAAREFFAAHGLDPAKATLFIQPFTSSPHKDWPPEKSLAFARHWKAGGLQIIFGGGPADRLALEPTRQAGFTVSAGVPLLTTMGLMSFAAVVVGADTGIIHLAVALGKRVVMLIGPNRPGASGPYQHPEWMVMPPAAQPVSAIRVDEVVAATDKALAESGARRVAPNIVGP